MTKSIFKIVLMSVFIFFTAQLGWSATTITSLDPNEAMGRNSGPSTEAATLAVGANYDCPSGTCHKNSSPVNFWEKSNFIPGSQVRDDSTTVKGTN